MVLHLQIANMIRPTVNKFDKVSRLCGSTAFVSPASLLFATGNISSSISNVYVPVQAFPAVLEVPSKEHPYDPNQDGIMQRVKGMFGGDLSAAT